MSDSDPVRTASPAPPFFIVGCPRSGTTLLQVLLDAHPNIAIPPESFLFQRFGGMFESYGTLENDSNLRQLAEELLSDERIIDWKLTLDADALIAKVHARSAPAVVSALFEAYADQHGKHMWGDKTPQHAMCLDNILDVFPDARFIHLVRDGRDVAESLSRVFIGPKSIYAIAGYWTRHVQAFNSFKNRMSPDQFIEPRFEELVANPDAARKKILEFIGADPRLINDSDGAVPETASKQQAVNAVSHHSSLAGPITTAKTGVYKKRFSTRELEIFEYVAGDTLRLYNYELATDGKSQPSTVEKLHAMLTDTAYRYTRKLFRPQPIKHLSKELKLSMQYQARLARRGSTG